MLEPHTAGEPRRARLRGTLFDTGSGYPALRPGPGPGVPGWVVELATPAQRPPIGVAQQRLLGVVNAAAGGVPGQCRTQGG